MLTSPFSKYSCLRAVKVSVPAVSRIESLHVKSSITTSLLNESSMVGLYFSRNLPCTNLTCCEIFKIKFIAYINFGINSKKRGL